MQRKYNFSIFTEMEVYMKKVALTLLIMAFLVSPLFADKVKVGNLMLDVTNPKKLGYGTSLFEGVLEAPAVVNLGTPPVAISLKVGAKIEYDLTKHYVITAYVARDTPLKASSNAIVIAADSMVSITDLMGTVYLSFCALSSDTKLVMGGKELIAKKTGKKSDVQFNSYGEIISVTLAKDLPYEIGWMAYVFGEGCRVIFKSGTGKIVEGGFKEGMNIKVGSYVVPLMSGKEYDNPIAFYDTGEVSRIYTSKAFVAKINGQDVPVKEKEQFHFYERGIVKRLIAGDNFNLLVDGKQVPVGYGQYVEYEKNGAFSKVSGSAKKKPTPPSLSSAPTPATAPIQAQTTLTQVPDSWNGDYALATNPTKKALTVKGGKIYLVMGSSETQTFPATSSLKYVYAYSNTECTATLGQKVDDSYKRDSATGKITHVSSGISETYLPLKK
jgi:hypothetical protein